MFLIHRYPVAIALLLLTSGVANAKPVEPRFGVDDMLDVVDVRIADLSTDGRWLAATATTLRDRIGVDNHRYGDPSYIAPRLFHVWVIEWSGF